MKRRLSEQVYAISDDVLFGAGKIAEFLFGDVKHRRKVYYLTNAAKNGIPHFKIGQTTCASKSALLRWITEQEEQNRRRSYPGRADSKTRSIAGIILRDVMDRIFRAVRGGKQ